MPAGLSGGRIVEERTPVQNWAENAEFKRGNYDDTVWIRRTTRLRFHLGEYCFAIWKIPCLALRSYYTELPAHPSETSIPRTLPAGVEALYLPSHPAPGSRTEARVCAEDDPIRPRPGPTVFRGIEGILRGLY